jgi:hypothetical protein
MAAPAIELEVGGRPVRVQPGQGALPPHAATISPPVTWDELPDVETEDFTMATMPARFAERGDLQRASTRPSAISGCCSSGWTARSGRALGEAPYPPNFPKMPGEPPRVQPSRARRQPDADG